MKEKIIFLDFDGVLNSKNWIESKGLNPSSFDPSCVNRLNDLIYKAETPRIVVSSAWRLDIGRDDRVPYTQGILAGIGCQCYVIGATPYLGGKERGYEIQSWLTLNSSKITVKSFVIIDDSDDMVHLSDKLVRTNFQVGLQDTDVELAVSMLRGKSV